MVSHTIGAVMFQWGAARELPADYAQQLDFTALILNSIREWWLETFSESTRRRLFDIAVGLLVFMAFFITAYIVFG